MLLSASGAALAADPAPAGDAKSDIRGVFISPMGEPFRPASGGPSPDVAWFQGADINHDGRLTMPEFRADAIRFFAALDIKHDGEIDPDDIERYETQILPEVRAMDFDGKGGGKGRKGGDENRGGGKGGRWGYFDMREPVSSADANLNRGVSRKEFDDAAIQRFRVLDEKHNGYLSLATLKPIKLGQAMRKFKREAAPMNPSEDTRADQ
jgi:hypothetical protein